MLKIGSLVDGKYKVLNQIGQGGMSVVYLAMNERANKQWAIKEVRKDGVQDFEVVRQGLIAETEILKSLHHPYLPSIIDIVDQDDSFLIVMDYIEGNPLSQKLEEEGAQPQERVIAWAKQMCDVLGYLHDQDPPIIYRDLKPGNIMLKPDGNITLIDFGTARKYREHGAKDTTCLGTIGYAAPEQFGGHGQTDFRTDIYCLGTTIYHLVTGCDPSEPPYKIQPIRQLNPALSPGLEKIILKCTKQDPGDRYQSCAELMYALNHYDEIDEKFLQLQKKRLAIFAVLACVTVLCFATGIATHVAAARTNTQQYDQLVEQAKYGSAEDAIKALQRAIQLKPLDVTAYQALIDNFLKDDVFSQQDEAILKNMWNRSKAELAKQDEAAYVNLCFEIGKLYWYHYEDPAAQDMQMERIQYAKPYFEIVKDAPGNEENRRMAQVYWNIADILENLNSKADEGADKGEYIQLFTNLQDMMDEMEAHPDERDIVKLEFYRLVISTMETHAQRFAKDGVSLEDITALTQQVFAHTQAISPFSEKAQELQDYILSQRAGVEEKLRTIV